jgi:hypothetical protein
MKPLQIFKYFEDSLEFFVFWAIAKHRAIRYSFAKPLIKVLQKLPLLSLLQPYSNRKTQIPPKLRNGIWVLKFNFF